MTDLALTLLIGGVVVSAVCAAVYKVRHPNVSSLEDLAPKGTVDILLLIGSALVILPALVLVLGSVFTKKPKDVQLPSLPPEDDPTDEESESERLKRTVDAISDATEEHIRDTASDDEVASRGAHLFDPGKEPDKDA